jgi:hypothetical protein
MIDPLHKLATIACDYPKIKDFTPAQLAALHEFKHEFIAAGFRLYQAMPVKYAVVFLNRLMHEFSDQMIADRDASRCDGEADPLRRVSTIACDYPKVKHLTPENLASLHAFKHEVVAAGYRLYQKLPRELAAPFLQSQVIEAAASIDASRLRRVA